MAYQFVDNDPNTVIAELTEAERKKIVEENYEGKPLDNVICF